MQGDHVRPGILTDARNRDRFAAGFVEAGADLRGNRQGRGRRHCAHDSIHQTQVSQATRSPVSLYDLLDGTPEIDVDEVGGIRFRD